MQIANHTPAVLSDVLALADDRQFCELLASLSQHADFSLDSLPVRLIAQRTEHLTDPKLKDQALASLCSCTWGKMLILETSSPLLKQYAGKIAASSLESEGLLGVSALAYKSRQIFKAGNPKEAWALFSAAANRLGDEPTTRLRSTAKLFHKLTDSNCFDRTMRVAVIGSSTIHYLAELLFVECAKIGLHISLYQGIHGNFRQEVLDPQSSLYSFKPDSIVFWNNKGDFDGRTEEEILVRSAAHKNLWSTLLERQNCRIIQAIPDNLNDASRGMLNWSHSAGGGVNLQRVLADDLQRDAEPSVWFLDLLSVRLTLNAGIEWESPKDWYTLQQTPSLSALPHVASALRSMLQASIGLTKKLAIIDLDNTLWGGVIGEDGVEGIQVGPDSPLGRAYWDFQLYLKGLQERGVILAVCSKNNEDDAKSPFLQKTDMPLKLSDFMAFQANWKTKCENIQEIVQRINVGIDSVIFIDDNPLERQLVRSNMPGVIVPSLPVDPSLYVQHIQDQRFFDSYKLSKEDLDRVKSYQSNAQRDILKSTAFSLEEYLVGLEMTCAVDVLNEKNIERVYQLIHKTNQFNLTNIRHDEPTVRAMIKRSDLFGKTFTLTDKFGGHGLIGVLIARNDEQEKAVLEIDTWLMSCRVLGRKMEEFMMDELVKTAKANKSSAIVGYYNKSKKNELVQDLLSRMGFIKDKSDMTRDRWIFQIPNDFRPLCNFVTRVES